MGIVNYLSQPWHCFRLEFALLLEKWYCFSFYEIQHGEKRRNDSTLYETEMI